MKTTIDIADHLLEQVKRRAREENRTLRELVEDALRRLLIEEERPESFRLKRHAFHGKGTQPGIAEGDWATIRELIYRI